MAPARRHAPYLFVVAGLFACNSPPPAAPAVDAEQAVATLVDGLGPSRLCRADGDCLAGGEKGACSMGTCFGLLTTDSRAIRRVLVDRLARAPVAVRQAAGKRIQRVYNSPTAGIATRVAVLEAMGALGRAHLTEADGERLILRLALSDGDAQVAATARVELASLGDATALPGLTEDLAQGTELLRAEAVRGLQGYAGTPQAPEAKALILTALADRSPVVQLAALRACQPWASEVAVRTALEQLVQERAPHLRYEVDNLLAPAKATAKGP